MGANWETRPRTVIIYCFVSFKRDFTRQIWEGEYTEPPKREEWLPLPWLFFVLLTIRIRSFFGGVFFFCIPRQDQWDRRAGRSARFFFSFSSLTVENHKRQKLAADVYSHRTIAITMTGREPSGSPPHFTLYHVLFILLFHLTTEVVQGLCVHVCVCWWLGVYVAMGRKMTP